MIRLCFVRPRWPVLIITPNMLLANQWKDEWNKWVTNAPVFVMKAKNSKFLNCIGAASIVCISSYTFLANSDVSLLIVLCLVLFVLVK